MARLTAAERAKLPDRAFAYVDSRGARRLPIHDESHVRNALARFDQVAFESTEAREKARDRLLRAAKRYVSAAIAAADGLGIGTGHGPVHHFHALWDRSVARC